MLINLSETSFLDLSETSTLNARILTILIILTAGAIIGFILNNFLSRIFYAALRSFITPELGDVARELIEPYKKLVKAIIALSILEVIAVVSPLKQYFPLIEVVLSLTLTLTITWLSFRLAGQFLDIYLLEIATKNNRKVNGELIISAKVISNILIVVIAFIAFAQTHQINVFGLLASLGIGGLAVAFAAQKTLEQFLGSVVIYLDRPFIIDDYIGLSDGTFGRVESIGWRSTKIRTSGKGTVVIIPNNSLTQMNIENFSGAKKVMSILRLDFDREVELKEQALIKQVILASTTDIFGLDSRSTDITFTSNTNGDGTTHNQAQVTFFILGSGEVSMELRRQLLDIARQNITAKLLEYGIGFDIDEPTIYVDAPITV
ncbi:mechanosensitive ion channel domain-containing protein [Mastigocoleus sp. MO_188.B34]|uniref:mechanosensitive ion channel family protein n=1 Tax=Mastigocoleus sp. MO_188.B34 TaxID=3036635 RepID=UPI002629FEA6|nr:mechanosensitive ion channel domain-containing protein [Mastigocoleus sp. MO_188.B34]MDJ0694616.1 mechanosensitive ion channel [Mastigocoleus sp. MO_188.B34]